jgi:hypothetical protein
MSIASITADWQFVKTKHLRYHISVTKNGNGVVVTEKYRVEVRVGVNKMQNNKTQNSALLAS